MIYIYSIWDLTKIIITKICLCSILFDIWNSNKAWEQAHIGAPRLQDEKENLLWSLHIFHFHPRNCRKNKPTNFHQKYWALAAQISRKIARLFDNNMQAQSSLLIKFCQRKTCDVKVYDLALVVRSLIMLLNGQTALCWFITRLQSHTCMLTL